MKKVSKEDGYDVLFDAMFLGNSSRAIENQESRGQSSFVNSDTLPKKCDKEALEKLGVIFGEDADDLFVFVTLPNGWKKEPIDHSMWSKLLDENGNEVASIFYKAAFYDRDAFLSMSRK